MGFGDFGAAIGGALGAGIGSIGGTQGAAIGMQAGSMLGGSFASGGSSSSSGYTLPPEYELQFLQQFEQNMQSLQRSYKQVSQMSNLYNQRMHTSYAAMQGTIPHADALKQMTASGVQIAQSLGLDPSEMVKQGLIQPGEHTALQQIYDIASQGTGYKDTVTENQIQEQKRSLQQELARSGVPPQQQMIALQQFENGANLQRQQAGQQKIASLTGYLGAAQSSLGALQGQLGFAQQGISGLAGLAGQQFGVNLQGQQAQQGLRQEGMQNYQTLGQFQFSNPTSRAIESGLVGPGTFAQQVGIGRDMIDPYQLAIRRGENAANMRGINLNSGQYDPRIRKALTGQQVVSAKAGSTGYAVPKFQNTNVVARYS